MSYPIRSFVCAFLILLLLSSGMLYLGDKLDASGMVVTRFMATGQAAVTAQIGYPETGRNQIAVVLYDEQFLRASDIAWPISYQEHASWLLRLAGQPGQRPKAIFLDITFGQERADPSLPALAAAFCTLRDSYRIPVFLAALPNQQGVLTVRQGLGACFTLVGVDYVPDPMDGYAWGYPLTRHLDANVWRAGAPTLPHQSSYRSAALALARDVGGVALGTESVPLALVWGAAAIPGAALAERDRGCVANRPVTRNLTPAVFLQFGPAPAPLCPYHRTFSMANINELAEPELAAAVANRYVMIGAEIPGHNDFAHSPVHGRVPGVHYHAMALDNLLSYGARYKLNHEWDLEGLPILLWPGLLTVLAVLAVHRLWSKARAQPEQWQWLKALRRRAAASVRIRPWTDQATRRGRTSVVLLRSLGWATRVTAQFVAAALLIALFQIISRAGMLPVTELIGMTLLAEAIGYLAWLRWYVLGEVAPPIPARSAPEPSPIPSTTTP